MPRSVIRRQLARTDIEQAAGYYFDTAGLVVAERFVAAVEVATTHAATHPEAGSARYAQTLDRPGLRFWVVKGFPYLVFYRDAGDRLDVWRVLHAERDIPAWLRESA
jgi:toxin ParE1/3/4